MLRFPIHLSPFHLHHRRTMTGDDAAAEDRGMVLIDAGPPHSAGCR
jgi:hypothetical protein